MYISLFILRQFSSIKSITCNSRFFLYFAQHMTEEIQTSPSVVPHAACGLIPLNLLAKTTTKLLLEGNLFLYTTLSLYLFLFFFVFSQGFIDIMCEDLLHGHYSLPFGLSGKVLPVTLTLLFFSFILYVPTRLFLSSTNKNSFFVTLLVYKTKLK